MAIALPKIQPFWKNPVIVLDMRVRLRGPKAFWNMAVYLGLLSALAMTGYALASAAAAGSFSDPVAIQSSLAGLYYFIFFTLATLITLIAPALTAVSIVTEKQRLTMDLLVTTPMSGYQMLLGKLFSSVAFLILLLVLSIPASSLCVILGGATIGDIFRTYALLITDGFVLAAIGLAYSCSARNNIQAIVSTYATIFLFWVVSMAVGSTTGFGVGRMGGMTAALPPAFALAQLNPFSAVTTPGSSVSVAGVVVPVWIATAVCAFVLVRLLLTAAALRLGMYGGGLIASLRRQVLLATFIAGFVIAQSISSLLGSSTGRDLIEIEAVVCSSIFFVALFFLPGLFVPAVDEDSPDSQVITGRYNWRKAFHGDHSGSLPYFHLWLLCLVASVIAGLTLSALPSSLAAMRATPTAVGYLAPGLGAAAAGAGLWTLAYLSGVGFLLWCIARRASTFSTGIATARPLTFVIFAFVVALPLIAMITINHSTNTTGSVFASPLDYVWMGYPFTRLDQPANEHWKSFLTAAGICYLVGTVIYAPWKSVAPGIRATAQRSAAATVAPPAGAP